MDDIERKAEILLSSPAPKLPSEDKEHTDCACRKIKIHVSEIQHHWTGVCHASDTICKECQRMVPKHALVVCLGCKAVVARMAPTILKSGFRIEARKIYHTDKCPNCKPGVASSRIIEAELFYRKK